MTMNPQDAVAMHIDLMRESMRDATDAEPIWYAMGFGIGMLCGWETAGVISAQERDAAISELQRAAAFEVALLDNTEVTG